MKKIISYLQFCGKPEDRREALYQCNFAASLSGLRRETKTCISWWESQYKGIVIFGRSHPPISWELSIVSMGPVTKVLMWKRYLNEILYLWVWVPKKGNNSWTTINVIAWEVSYKSFSSGYRSKMYLTTEICV